MKRHCENKGYYVTAQTGDYCPACGEKVTEENHPLAKQPEKANTSSSDSRIPSLQSFLWGVTAIASLISVLVVVGILGSAESAVQEAAGAAFALCIAVIPYVLARSVSELSS